MKDRGARSGVIRPQIGVVLGFLFLSTGFFSSSAWSSSETLNLKHQEVLTQNADIHLAQHGGPPEGRGPRHGGRGKHCPEMGHQRDCRKGMGKCPGGMGMGRRGGMGCGMHHEGGKGGVAQCPQTRATVKAPEEFYNQTNPIENTLGNIEKGRLLFQLDSQPTCVMCHGSKGDGTGGFGSNLSPPPRNFACGETMKGISDGQLFWIIRNGSPDTGMPPFQDLKDEQIWELIIFIRSLEK